MAGVGETAGMPSGKKRRLIGEQGVSLIGRDSAAEITRHSGWHLKGTCYSIQGEVINKAPFYGTH